MIARYEYDALNRRTKEFVNADTDDDFDSFRHFYYNFGWQLLETRLATSENDEPEDLYPEYQYVWSVRYMDAPVLRDKNTDDDDLCDDERLYYANDANMNVTALLATDGTPLERYVYDPYGKVTVLDADFSADADGKSDYDNRILFAGYYFDNETGLYHVRNRYYHPQLGWITRDPAGYADGMSLYEYCRSGPLVATDAMGLCTAPGQAGPDAEGDGSNTAKEVLPPWKQPGYKGGDNGVPAREQPPVGPWQPKNEGPVRRGGGGGSDDEEFSWWGTFASALGQNLADRAEGILLGLNPGTWVEGGIRDYEAGIRRGQSGFDAALDAIARNTPGLNVGTGLAEAIAGTHLGGPLHGQPLQWYDRGGRVGNFVAWEAGAGAALAAKTGYNPTLGRAPSSVAGDLQGASQRAAGTVGPGRGPVYGSQVHSAFGTEVNALGNGNLTTEVSYLNGQVVPRGTPGSVRLDVVEGSLTGPTAIHDLKTGSATLTPARIRQIQSNIPGGANVPINEVRP